MPLASLSLDLDNKWSYLKTHGDAGWEAYPTYLPTVVPRVLEVLAERDQRITFFLVGKDCENEANHAPLRSIADAGHEIGNHSYHHEPWLHLYPAEQIAQELASTEHALERVTGQRPIGFRGPGYSFSPELHRQLCDRGYRYDASTFPTFLGPLARTYYFWTANLTKEEKEKRKRLFGRFSEGFRPLRGYLLPDLPRPVAELPVTTMPIFKTPIHFSYLLYLAEYSRALAMAYFRVALGLCRLTGVEPSLLLHPLDFLGADDDRDLGFFPGMNRPAAEKIRLVGEAIDLLRRGCQVVPMREHAAAVLTRQGAPPVDAEPAPRLAGVGAADE